MLEAEVEALGNSLTQHLTECADRYKSLQSLVLTVSKIIISLLLSIIAWLLVHFVFRGVPL